MRIFHAAIQGFLHNLWRRTSFPPTELPPPTQMGLFPGRCGALDARPPPVTPLVFITMDERKVLTSDNANLPALFSIFKIIWLL